MMFIFKYIITHDVHLVFGLQNLKTDICTNFMVCTEKNSTAKIPLSENIQFLWKYPYVNVSVSTSRDICLSVQINIQSQASLFHAGWRSEFQKGQSKCTRNNTYLIKMHL